MSLDAMKQALRAAEFADLFIKELVTGSTNREVAKQVLSEAITALRAAIEQAQEPVAWQVMVEDEAMKEFPIKDMAHDWCAKKKLSGSPSAYWIRPLYTAPRQWQRLTEQEIKDCEKQAMVNGALPFEQRSFFARAIEAKLREKNA